MQRYHLTNAFRGSPELVFTGTLDFLNKLSCRFTHILQENIGKNILITKRRLPTKSLPINNQSYTIQPNDSVVK
jgi:hypothetical protein